MNTSNGHPSILKHMAAVADVIRCRMLRILARHELTVSELCTVLQLPQSTVSRHLKALLDDGWVTSRRDGTSRFYNMVAEELAPDARGLWALIEAQVAESAAADQDEQRVEVVLAGRRSKSREFFASAADQWDHVREELFGRGFHLQALLGLLDDDSVFGDLGCGTGVVSQALAPFVRKVVAVDGSAEMLETASRRLSGLGNVDLRRGELEALPVRDGELDAAAIVLVLHYVSDPARVLTEAARALRPGGRLLIVDMLPHEREEYQQHMGHVWLGFSEPQVSRYLAHAGFERARVTPLPADPEARGPRLFAATAVRAEATPTPTTKKGGRQLAVTTKE
jgi:ubiquinone/menaquinone biosynthesis C-methylase UbiE